MKWIFEYQGDAVQLGEDQELVGDGRGDRAALDAFEEMHGRRGSLPTGDYTFWLEAEPTNRGTLVLNVNGEAFIPRRPF